MAITRNLINNVRICSTKKIYAHTWNGHTYSSIFIFSARTHLPSQGCLRLDNALYSPSLWKHVNFLEFDSEN